MISLAGKAALITGGSRGIGAAAVKMFAQAGADVVFSYNKAKDAAKIVEQDAGKHGTRVEAFKADVGQACRQQEAGGIRHCAAGPAGHRGAQRRRVEHRRPAHRENDREAVGRDDPHQSEERVLDHSFLGAAHDQAKDRQDHSDHLDGGAARRIVSHALWSVEGRDRQPGKGAFHASWRGTTFW